MGDLSLQEAAERLGVHYMTAYRYVRLGVLPARKEGVVWRVDEGDLAALEARGDRAPAAGGRRPRKRARWDERLEGRLLAGDVSGAWGVVESALTAGADLGGVYVDVISPAMASIGRRWAAGELDVADEHRASAIALRLIARLGPMFARRGRTRGSVVLACPPGDHHALPVAMLADLVRAAGFEAVELGADVPASSLSVAVREAQRLVAVGLSVGRSGSDDEVRAAVAAVRAVSDVPVLMGGPGLGGLEEARTLGADAWAGDARAAVALVEQVAEQGALGGPGAVGESA